MLALPLLLKKSAVVVLPPAVHPLKRPAALQVGRAEEVLEGSYHKPPPLRHLHLSKAQQQAKRKRKLVGSGDGSKLGLLRCRVYICKLALV